MTDYWTDDSLPPLASPQRILVRWAVAAMSLVTVGFGMGWFAAGGQPEPIAGPECPLQNRQCELRAVAIELNQPTSETAKIEADGNGRSKDVGPNAPDAKTTPVARDKALKQ